MNEGGMAFRGTMPPEITQEFSCLAETLCEWRFETTASKMD